MTKKAENSVVSQFEKRSNGPIFDGKAKEKKILTDQEITALVGHIVLLLSQLCPDDVLFVRARLDEKTATNNRFVLPKQLSRFLYNKSFLSRPTSTPKD
jgi:hypothetical protein